MLTSTNYDNAGDKITGCKNGYGAKCTNIFSKKFIVETVDSKRKKKYKQEFHNNKSIINKPEIIEYKEKSFTKITFIPDFKRFNIDGLDDDIYELMLSLNHSGWKITIQRLATRLNCSTRTIHRNMCHELRKEIKLLNKQL